MSLPVTIPSLVGSFLQQAPPPLLLSLATRSNPPLGSSFAHCWPHFLILLMLGPRRHRRALHHDDNRRLSPAVPGTTPPISPSHHQFFIALWPRPHTHNARRILAAAPPLILFYPLVSLWVSFIRDQSTCHGYPPHHPSPRPAPRPARPAARCRRRPCSGAGRRCESIIISVFCSRCGWQWLCRLRALLWVRGLFFSEVFVSPPSRRASGRSRPALCGCLGCCHGTAIAAVAATRTRTWPGCSGHHLHHHRDLLLNVDAAAFASSSDGGFQRGEQQQQQLLAAEPLGLGDLMDALLCHYACSASSATGSSATGSSGSSTSSASTSSSDSSAASS